jgi:hypothetical protein
MNAMRHLILSIIMLFCATVASAQNDKAADVKKPATETALEGDEYVFAGLAFTPFRLDAKVAGFDVELQTSAVREARLSLPTASPFNSAGPHLAMTSRRPVRMTDTRLSLRRSFNITKKLVVDTLARAEIPTGDVRRGLGNGRAELMADIGIRTELKSLSLWAGAARRFGRETIWSNGRDVNEVYAGWNKQISASQDVRMDFVKTGKRYRNDPNEMRLSAEYSKTTKRGGQMTLYASRDVGYWGKDIRVGIQFNVRLGRLA